MTLCIHTHKNSTFHALRSCIYRHKRFFSSRAQKDNQRCYRSSSEDPMGCPSTHPLQMAYDACCDKYGTGSLSRQIVSLRGLCPLSVPQRLSLIRLCLCVVSGNKALDCDENSDGEAASRPRLPGWWHFLLVAGRSDSGSVKAGRSQPRAMLRGECWSACSNPCSLPV